MVACQLVIMHSTLSFPLRLNTHLRRYISVVGTVALVIAVLVKAPTHQSGKFVFSTFIDGTGVDGVGWSERASPAYVAVIGILMAQYTLTGFDASAHVSACFDRRAKKFLISTQTLMGL